MPTDGSSGCKQESELAKGVMCAHRTGKLSASSAGEAAWGLFCMSSPENIILTGSQGILTWQAMLVSPPFPLHPRTPQSPS